MSEKPQVVLVGTGFGGVGMLHKLFETQKGDEQEQHEHGKELPFDLTVIDGKTHLTIGASWQYVWTDRLKEVPMWPLQSLKYLDKVQKAVIGEGDASAVESLSLGDKSITMEDGSIIKYDTLVLSPGVVSDATKIEGLAEAAAVAIAIDICDLKSVTAMKDRVQKLSSCQEPQTVLVCVTKMPYKVGSNVLSRVLTRWVHSRF